MLTLSEADGLVTLHLPEEFDFRLHQEFRACYEGRPPAQRYVIDFKVVARMDSSALGMLLLMRSYCGNSLARIQLVNCNKKVLDLLKTATYDTFFTIS